jgi:hypothetical protein
VWSVEGFPVFQQMLQLPSSSLMSFKGDRSLSVCQVGAESKVVHDWTNQKIP